MKKIVAKLVIASIATIAFVACGDDGGEKEKEKDSKQTESASESESEDSSGDEGKTLAESEGVPEFKWEDYDLSQFDEACIDAMKADMEASKALREAQEAMEADPDNRELQMAYSDAVSENSAAAHDDVLVDCMDDMKFYEMYMAWKAWDAASSITEEDIKEMEEKAEELEKMAKELEEKYN